MTLGLSHFFVFVDDEDTALTSLRRCGLVPVATSQQDGQGTASLFVAFANAFLELIWAEDANALVSVEVARTRMAERSRWHETGASPFGIGLNGRLPFPWWEYRPPHATKGVSVALGSDDPRQPFLFSTEPGLRLPTHKPVDARLAGTVTGLHIDLPVGASPAIRTLADLKVLTFAPAISPRAILSIATAEGPRQLVLPDFTWG